MQFVGVVVTVFAPIVIVVYCFRMYVPLLPAIVRFPAVTAPSDPSPIFLLAEYGFRSMTFVQSYMNIPSCPAGICPITGSKPLGILMLFAPSESIFTVADVVTALVNFPRNTIPVVYAVSAGVKLPVSVFVQESTL